MGITILLTDDLPLESSAKIEIELVTVLTIYPHASKEPITGILTHIKGEPSEIKSHFSTHEVWINDKEGDDITFPWKLTQF